MKLLIATWGYPFSWKLATYRYGNGEMLAKTTLPVLIKELRPDQVIIVSPDTVLTKSAADELLNSEHLDYPSVKNKVRSLVEGYVEKNVKSLLSHNKVPVKVELSYNAGRYGNLVFARNLEDFRLKLFYIFWKVFSKIDFAAEDGISVYLDMTHGLNYMPALTLNVLEKLLTALSVFSEVSFTVLNSEPYPVPMPSDKEAQKKVRLTIREVLSTKYDRGDFVKLKAVQEAKGSDYLYFLISVLEGYLLGIMQFFTKSSELDEEMDVLVRNYEHSTDVSVRKGEMRISSRCFPKEMENLVYSAIFSKFLEDVLGIEVKLSDLSIEVMKAWGAALYSGFLRDVIRKNLGTFENPPKEMKIVKRGFPVRHFKAHSGLLTQYIDRKEQGGVEVFSYKREYLGEVKRLILRTHFSGYRTKKKKKKKKKNKNFGGRLS